jgi:hypothetical protein
VQQLSHTDCTRNARVIIEKPFGRDLPSALALNQILLQTFDERMIYRIDHRIETLAENAVRAETLSPVFDLLDVKFVHWDFNPRDGWLHNYWLAMGNIEASNLDQAFKLFRDQLGKIVPKIALIAQCYVDSVFQPFLVLRADKDVAFFRYVRDAGAVGLMFMEKELKALNRLLENSEIPEEFYYYWNDAVNSMGYSSKLLLMFSAIEALVKIRTGPATGQKDWARLEQILGADLKMELWGEIGASAGAVRHRLVHGEYFRHEDMTKNYVELVHRKIVIYFNDVIFHEALIDDNVVNPQRHLFGNKEGWRGFLKADDRVQLNLKDVLADASSNGFENMEHYETVYDAALTGNY